MPPSASAGAMFSCGLPRCLCCFPAHCGSFITAPPLRTRRASIRPLSCCFCRSAGRVLPLVCCCAHFKRLRAAFHNLHSRIFRHGIFDLPRLHPVQIRCFRLQQRDSACGQHRFLLYALFHLPLCGQHGRKTRKISCRTPIHCAHCFCGSGCDRFWQSGLLNIFRQPEGGITSLLGGISLFCAALAVILVLSVQSLTPTTCPSLPAAIVRTDAGSAALTPSAASEFTSCPAATAQTIFSGTVSNAPRRKNTFAKNAKKGLTNSAIRTCCLPHTSAPYPNAPQSTASSRGTGSTHATERSSSAWQ